MTFHSTSLLTFYYFMGRRIFNIMSSGQTIEAFLYLFDITVCLAMTIPVWLNCFYLFFITLIPKVKDEQFVLKINKDEKQVPKQPNIGSEPDDKKEDWKKKINDFWQKHKVVITISLGIIATIGGYYIYKNYLVDKNIDDSDSDDDDNLPQETPAQRSQRLFIERHQMLDAKRRNLEPSAQRLMSLLEQPGYENFGLYLSAICRICDFYPFDTYLSYHLLRVVNPSVTNNASRSVFIRLAHCIEDPDYAGQEAGTRYWARSGLPNPAPGAKYKISLINHILSLYSQRSSDELLEAGAPELEQYTAEALRALRADPAVAAALDELAKILRTLAPLVRHWN